MIKDILGLITKELEELKPKLEKCRELQKANVSIEIFEKLKRQEGILEQQCHRLSICVDILEGKTFVIHDVDGDLTVCTPTEGTAKLIDAAEKRGAKVTSLEFKQEKLV